MLHVLALIRFQEQHRSVVITAMQEHACNSRLEDGCQRYEVYLQNDAATIMTQECWRDAASETAHMQGPVVANLIAKIGGFLTAAPEIMRFEQVA